jgi:hypothetical protein
MGVHKKSRAMAWSVATGVYCAAAAIGRSLRLRRDPPPPPPPETVQRRLEEGVMGQDGALTLTATGVQLSIVADAAAFAFARGAGVLEVAPAGAGLVRVEGDVGASVRLRPTDVGANEVQRVAVTRARPCWLLAPGALLACAGPVEVSRPDGDAEGCTVVRLLNREEGGEDAMMWLASRGRAEIALVAAGEQMRTGDGAMLAEELRPTESMIETRDGGGYVAYVQLPPPRQRQEEQELEQDYGVTDKAMEEQEEATPAATGVGVMEKEKTADAAGRGQRRRNVHRRVR